MQREVAYGVATGISGAVNRKLAPLHDPRVHLGFGLSVGAAVGAVLWLSMRKRERLNRLEKKLDLVIEETVPVAA